MSKKPANTAFNGIVVLLFCICFFLTLVGAMIPSIRVLFLCIFGIPCIPLVVILVKSSSKKNVKNDDEDSDSVNSINMRNAKELGTDLVEADYFNGCCGECAKYRGRWFSISGKDKRFPKMPPEDYGCTCQGLSFYPVIYGISEPTSCPKNVNIIKYSNRSFVDDRTEEEKRLHQEYLNSK